MRPPRIAAPADSPAGLHDGSRRRWLARGVATAAWLGAGGATMAAPAERGQTVAWPRVALLDGSVWTLEAMAGRAALVVFFSTTCPYCARHNQHVARLMRERPDLPLAVLGVAEDRDPAAVRRYLASRQLAFPVTLDAAPMHEALSQRRTIPLTCVVDRQGRLREVIPGEMFEDDVLGLAKWATA